MLTNILVNQEKNRILFLLYITINQEKSKLSPIYIMYYKICIAHYIYVYIIYLFSYIYYVFVVLQYIIHTVAQKSIGTLTFLKISLYIKIIY